MAYIFTAITETDTSGEAFTLMNANLAAIENNQGNITGDYLPLSGGTLTGGLSGITFALGEGSYFNTLSSVTLSANRTINLPNKNGTVALLNDLTGFTSGNYVPLTGTSSGSPITGDIVITNSNNLRVQDGTDTNSLELFINSIDFRDDYNSVKTRLQYSPQVQAESLINIFDTLPDGYMVIGPNPNGEGGNYVRVNSSANGWEYFNLEGNFVKNTGDTITGVYTINENAQNEAKIDIIGTAPTIALSGDGAMVKVSGIDILSKTTIFPESIIFDDLNLTSLQIRPLLFGATTGSSTLDIIKPTGNTDGYFVTVGDITSRPNEFIKVNNSGTGFEFGTLTGTSGGGVTGVTSAGTGNRLLLSGTVVNNNIVQKSLLAGSNVSITDSNGTITISSTGGTGTVTGATSAGGGIAIYQSATTDTLTFRSISGSNGFEATSVGSLAIVRPVAAARTANRMLVTDGSGNMTTNANIQIEQTIGGIGIGGVGGVATARLQIQAQSASIAPLRFNKTATDYTGAIDGSVWYLTSGNTLKFYKSNISTEFIFKDNNTTLTGTSNNRVVQADSSGSISASASIVSFGLFNVITSTTITNTTTETSIIPTGGTQLVGSNILNASSNPTSPQLVAGKKFRFTAKGEIQTKNSAAGTLDVKIKLGSSIISTSSAFTLVNNVNTPNVFEINHTFTIRTQGVSGTVIGSGGLHASTPFHTGSHDTYALYNQGVVTIDTTSDKVFDCTVQFGTADATNTLTINEATLEYLN